METNFDWEFYLLYNNDIISNFDNNEKEILEHYNKYGRNENRIINEINLYKSYPFIKFFDWIIIIREELRKFVYPEVW